MMLKARQLLQEARFPPPSQHKKPLPYLLLCCPVLCRNAFKVARRSSLIFSCKGKNKNSKRAPNLRIGRRGGDVFPKRSATADAALGQSQPSPCSDSQHGQHGLALPLCGFKQGSFPA